MIRTVRHRQRKSRLKFPLSVPLKWYTKTGHGGGRNQTGSRVRLNTVYITHEHLSR